MHTLLRFFATAAVLFGLSLSAHAQSWKPFCVEGGAGQGQHNSTWHLVNTPSTGGGTWKPLGGCVAPPPPPPPVIYNYFQCGYPSYDGGNGVFWQPTGAFITTSTFVFPVGWINGNPNLLLVGTAAVSTLQPNGSWILKQFSNGGVSGGWNTTCDLIDSDTNYMALYNRHTNDQFYPL